MWQGLRGNAALSGARDGVSRLIASGSSWMGSLGERIKTIVEPGSLGADSANSYENARLDQELRSRRILLHLLARKGQFEELLQIAESTCLSDEASWAVNEIIDERPECMASLLVRLGHGDSFATLPAISALFKERLTDRMVPLLASRLKTGEMLALVADGRAQPFALIDLLGALEQCGVNVDSVSYFEGVWRCLEGDESRRNDLLSAIFGDPVPGGFRYVPEKNMVPNAVKARALELLFETRPPHLLRTLWYASRNEDDASSWTATVSLIEYWQSEAGKIPLNMEPFLMLDTSLLYFLCRLSASFEWSGPVGVSELYQQLVDDRNEIETVDPSTTRAAGLQDRIDRIEEQLVEITERRVETLQPLVDTITRYMNLPHAKLEASDTDSCAAYVIGFGTILLSRRVLFDDRPLSEDFMASILHELLHMEQDTLLIRMIADDLNLKFGQHGPLLKHLFQRYFELMGYAPDSIFLLEVLRRRADVPLNSLERIRAERLAEAAVEGGTNAELLEKIALRLERIGASYWGLKDGSYDQYLLEFLQDDVGLRSLFQNGHIPAVLLQEIESCREDVCDFVNTAYGAKLSIELALNKAMDLWHEDDAPAIDHVLERLKTVVMQVLNEEWRSLEKRCSELRRAGYHEFEAYEISDRVEVMVKALRKGWYA